MTEMVIREGFFQGTRHRKLDQNKKPIEEWSNWWFAPCNGSGHFSYLYSRRFMKDSVTETEIYSNDNQPEWPDEFKYQNSPDRRDREAYSRWLGNRDKWYKEVYNKWHKSRPIVGYIQKEHRNIPGKQVISMDDVK